MTLQMTPVEAAGRTATTHMQPGKPLLLTMRMAAVDMNLWERIWPSLAQDFSIATFNLPAPDPAAYADPRQMYRELGEVVVDVARSLGHERFHYLGWTGGAALGLHMLVDHSEHLLSTVLFGALLRDHEQRDRDRFMEILDVLLSQENGLELYTWWWMQYSFSPAWLHEHYDEVEAMVARRMHADRHRKLDTARTMRWIEAMIAPQITDAELAAVTVPALIVGAPFDHHVARTVHRRIPSSELVIVNGAAFAPYERPDVFLAAIRPFHRAVLSRQRVAANGHAPARETRRDGARLVWNESQAAAGVLLLHGWLMSPSMWASQIEALRRRGIRAVAIAQPGHEGSAAAPDDYTMDAWVEDTVALADELGLERFVIAGHSMGGMLALAIAARHPERVAGLCLIGTTDEAWPANKQDEFLNLVGAVSMEWSSVLAATVGPLRLGEEFLKRTPELRGSWPSTVERYELPMMTGLGRAIAHRPDLTAASRNINVPTVVIHGTEDDAVEYEYGERLAARIPGARLVTAAGAGHCTPLETPALVADALVALTELALYGVATPSTAVTA